MRYRSVDMIRFSKIDDKLTIYKEKEIILFGAGGHGKRIKKELESKGFEIAYFCDNDEKKWGTEIENLKVISPENLCEIYNEKVLIQISTVFSEEIEVQLMNLKMDSFISFYEYSERMAGLYIYKTLPQSLEIYKEFYSKSNYLIDQTRKDCLDYAVKVKYLNLDSYNILCMPPKTGNYTLMASLGKCGAEYVRFGHSYNRMFEGLKELIGEKRIKIVTAVRDPIAQNLSLFFQITSNLCYCDIPEYWENGGDVQAVWDLWTAYETGDEFRTKSVFSYMESTNGLFDNVIIIQRFFDENFKKFNDIDVYNYEFDKEHGYTIIKKENIEIFIYQLERLEEVKHHLGTFLGVKDLTLTNGNVGDRKWYASIYKQALKELKLSKEYFEYCYNSNYVKHFYTENDIERFKDRWSKNIGN